MATPATASAAPTASASHGTISISDRSPAASTIPASTSTALKVALRTSPTLSPWAHCSSGERRSSPSLPSCIPMKPGSMTKPHGLTVARRPAPNANVIAPVMRRRPP
jgi:hypothetical protein